MPNLSVLVTECDKITVKKTGASKLFIIYNYFYKIFN